MYISRLAAVGFSVLWLAGCSSLLPGKDVAQTPAAVEQAVEAAQPVEARPPNPYLQNRKSVPSAARKLFASAVEAMEGEQWQRAESLLLQLTVDYPELSGGYLNLGVVYHNMAKGSLAEDYFKQAIEVNRNNLDAYNWLARLKREQGDFKAADALYRKALAIWPDHAASHYNLAILCELYLGNLVRAREHYMAYQQLQSEPNRQVAGWLKDLQRRIQALAKTEVES